MCNDDRRGGGPPEPVRRSIMHMTWSTLTFLHWPYEPAWVQALLPPGLTVQTFDGLAWVGLVPFEMTVRWPDGPIVPWLSAFRRPTSAPMSPGRDGNSGVWFLSLDASRLPVVAAAHAGWGLPYYWNARMSVARRGDRVRYESDRTWPWPAFRPAAYLRAEVLVGEPFPASEMGPFEHFLTDRFALWAHRLRHNWRSRAEHPPWTLRRAEVRALDAYSARRGGARRAPRRPERDVRRQRGRARRPPRPSQRPFRSRLG